MLIRESSLKCSSVKMAPLRSRGIHLQKTFWDDDVAKQAFIEKLMSEDARYKLVADREDDVIGMLYYANPHNVALLRRKFDCTVNPCADIAMHVKNLKDWDYREEGELPMSQKQKGEAAKRRWDEAFASAQEGRFDDIPADIRFRYWKNVQQIRADYLASKTKLPPLGSLFNHNTLQ